MELNRNSPFSLLDANLTKHILSYVITNKKDLGAALLVNKEWSSLVKEIFCEMGNRAFSTPPLLRSIPNLPNDMISGMPTHTGRQSLPNPPFALNVDPSSFSQGVKTIITPSGKKVQINFKTLMSTSLPSSPPVTAPIGAPFLPLPTIPRPPAYPPSTEAQHTNALEEFNTSQQPLNLSSRLWNVTSQQTPVPILWNHPHTIVPHNSRIAVHVYNPHRVIRVKVVSKVMNSQNQQVPLEPNTQSDIIVTPFGRPICNLNPREAKIMMVFTALYSDSPLGLNFVAIPNPPTPDTHPFVSSLTLNVHPPQPTAENGDSIECQVEFAKADATEEEPKTAENESIENSAERVQKEDEENEPIENPDDDEKEGKEKEQGI